MSRQLALDIVNLRPAARCGHTEYSLAYHERYVQKATGLAADDPRALSSLYDQWDIDFLFHTSHGLHGDWETRGRATDMGHAVYAGDGHDRREPKACPFHSADEVWSFDAVREYGLPAMDDQVAAFEQAWQQARDENPGQLTTGGYYRTIVSGAIQAFGWEMLLVGAADIAKMEPVFDSFYRYTKHHMQALARTSAEVIIQHDDFVWASGPFMYPDIYRAVIIPRYADLWKVLHAAGKKVLFCSDGNYMEFVDDIRGAGADGFIFEPFHDFGAMAERFGDSMCLIGSDVDCRDMTFGRWDKTERGLQRTIELASKCRGLIVAVGNHLPANIPDDMLDRYIGRLKSLLRGRA